ncbi:cardiolipin synthase [Flavobacteriaceae bacterium F89]|uniref:Cardiolipin synthase n=1 Tax=Cerina litoralis TaxID=2874477 RepID=A0AAE3EVY0_9FLAO|nr:cardiolipin synthase [Cerina litoralis]MCG2462020.1 cardiolipin synthase [Cerina litoralis]
MLAYISDHIWQLLLVLNYLLVIFFSIFILLKNKNPVKTLSYLFALATLPFLGLLVYYFFGQDYRKYKIFEKKYLVDDAKLKQWRAKFKLDSEEKEEFVEDFGDGNYKIYKLLRNNEKAVLTFHNKAKELINGEEKFKALREDLESAKEHIHMEYFVLTDDILGKEIMDTLCEKAKHGVKVRLIYDDVGSKISSKYKTKLSDSGVDHHPFMPVIFSKFTSQLNYRDHRKIVVIDGEIGYVGGINIRKKYDNSFTDNGLFWRDTHLRLEGEAVGALQTSFLLNWNFVSNEEVDTTDLFPKPILGTFHNTAVQIAASGPDTDWANIMEAMFAAINGASKYIYITSPYLIPNGQILTSLTTASRSGVDVRVIIPRKSDSWAAQYATDSYIEQLLDSGVRVYRYSKGFVHAKTMVIDGLFTSIGTANLDYRSFSINFEINALLYDKEMADRMERVFKTDLEDSQEVEVKRWKERGLKRKLQESFSRLWAPLL